MVAALAAFDRRQTLLGVALEVHSVTQGLALPRCEVGLLSVYVQITAGVLLIEPSSKRAMSC